MRMQRIVLACALLIGAGGAAWSQENRGTPEQQMACTPDVWRLCSSEIPQVSRIVACLRANYSQLSGNCRTAFDANEGGPPAPTETARAVPQQPPPRARAAPPAVSVRPQAAQRPSNPWYDD